MHNLRVLQRSRRRQGRRHPLDRRRRRRHVPRDRAPRGELRASLDRLPGTLEAARGALAAARAASRAPRRRRCGCSSRRCATRRRAAEVSSRCCATRAPAAARHARARAPRGPRRRRDLHPAPEQPQRGHAATSATRSRVLNYVVNELGYNPPGPEEGYLFWLAWFFHNADSILSIEDAHGRRWRGGLITSCSTLTALAAGEPGDGAADRPSLPVVPEGREPLMAEAGADTGQARRDDVLRAVVLRAAAVPLEGVRRAGAAGAAGLPRPRRFPEATQLADQADVRISGVHRRQGRRASAQAGSRTRATIELDAQVRAARRATRARSCAPKTLLGETYVELSPGSRGAPKLPEGGGCPTAQVQPTTELDEVIRAFTPRTRRDLRRSSRAWPRRWTGATRTSTTSSATPGRCCATAEAC